MNEQLQSIIRLPVEIGDTDMFDLILKSNSITDEEKHDILIYSILNSTEPDFVQHVLDSGLNESLLNESDDGSTLLHYAAASDSEEILKLFLKARLTRYIRRLSIRITQNAESKRCTKRLTN